MPAIAVIDPSVATAVARNAGPPSAAAHRSVPDTSIRRGRCFPMQRRRHLHASCVQTASHPKHGANYPAITGSSCAFLSCAISIGTPGLASVVPTLDVACTTRSTGNQSITRGLYANHIAHILRSIAIASPVLNVNLAHELLPWPDPHASDSSNQVPDRLHVSLLKLTCGSMLRLGLAIRRLPHLPSDYCHRHACLVHHVQDCSAALSPTPISR